MEIGKVEMAARSHYLHCRREGAVTMEYGMDVPASYQSEHKTKERPRNSIRQRMSS